MKKYIILILFTFVISGAVNSNAENIKRVDILDICMDMYYEYAGGDAHTVYFETPPFRDAITDSRFDHLYDAFNLGFVNYASDGYFDGLRDITREEAATIMYKTAKFLNNSFYFDDIGFDDKNLCEDWSITAVEFCLCNDILHKDRNGMFNPKGTIDIGILHRIKDDLHRVCKFDYTKFDEMQWVRFPAQRIFMIHAFEEQYPIETFYRDNIPEAMIEDKDMSYGFYHTENEMYSDAYEYDNADENTVTFFLNIVPFGKKYDPFNNGLFYVMQFDDEKKCVNREIMEASRARDMGTW